MADNYWTDPRIRELEHDLDAQRRVNPGAEWLYKRLNEPGAGPGKQSKAEILTTLDSIGAMASMMWDSDTSQLNSTLVAWLHEWKKQHGG